jgi:hypothetical protein
LNFLFSELLVDSIYRGGIEEKSQQTVQHFLEATEISCRNKKLSICFSRIQKHQPNTLKNPKTKKKEERLV